MKKVVLVVQFLILVMVVASCKHQDERKTILIDGGVDDEQIEMLNGSVKEVLSGDSTKADNFNHIYFDQRGNMVRANAKYISYHDTVYRKVVYKSEYDKYGKRILLKANYSVYPDSCGCNGILKWKFDNKERVIESISDKIRFDHFIEYKYDSLGRVNYKNVWGKMEDPEIYRYKYDNNNHLKSLETYEPEIGNKKGHLVNTINFHYLNFDSHNNWIMMVTGTDTITRKITYY
ncbi:hypothetical protein KXQ82_15865 [Mucilaginibacter sp. HMF5004]|uniref:hypothetical protein n=1 Tax=Mucilaginibacter rivuli TaxID=2857527 RepID=UPI001C5EA1DE|nr:hypothetical protein [Mucilaginibacter rivuli]MBW4891203.1 hypothetical protein [Mucilaginibacter rivuli]